MKRSSICVVSSTALVAIVLTLITLGCASPPPEEPSPAEEPGAITTEDFESGSAESMQPAEEDGEESEAENGAPKDGASMGDEPQEN